MSKFFKYIKKYWTPYLDLTKRIAVAGIVTLSIVSLLLLVYLIGFDVEVQTQGSIHWLLDRIIYLFMLFCAAKYLSEYLAVRRLNRKQLSWRASVVYAMLYLMFFICQTFVVVILNLLFGLFVDACKGGKHHRK